MTSFCLRHATVLDGSGQFAGHADVVVADGRIVSVDRDVTTEAPALDATGLFLMPGAPDVLTRFPIGIDPSA